MVTRKLYDSFTKAFGEKYFIPAYKTLLELKQAMVEIRQHITEGGLFMIFPSGGDKEDGRDMTFNHGFRTILDNMVYAYHVDVEQAIALRNNKIKSFVGLASDILTNELINPNKIGEPRVVEMDELYTQAGSWQEVVKQARQGGIKPEIGLTEHYQNLFSVK